MYFETIHAALYMEGHGIYVWPAYLVSLVVIVLLLLAPVRRRRRTLAQLAGELRRKQNLDEHRLAGRL